jgi:uncharacterized membrane protein
MFDAFWIALENLPPFRTISSTILFPWIESLHVLSIVLVVGSIAMVDLRLLGFRARERGVRSLIGEVLTYTWAAFACAAVTGLLLFCSSASGYVANPAFRIKAVLLVLAGLNMVYFHLLPYRTVHLWDDLVHPPLRARIAGGISLACWIGVVAAGRWIGFI